MAGRGRRGPRAREGLALAHPLDVHALYHEPARAIIPDPVEFVLSDQFLDRPRLYPRQATFLKLVFLAVDQLTQYDYDVIGEWGEAFARTGEEGCQPDVLERVRVCREQGRGWFREVLAVIGRRGSKGYMGALFISYVLWQYMHRPGGPQEYYGIDRDKRLTCQVFGAKREMAKANQWQDIVNVVVGAPCFTPWISRAQAERLTVYSPADVLRAQRLMARGLELEADLATFEIVPRESTLVAGRGPTSFAQAYDELAHLVNSGSNRNAEAVYQAATPSLDQFGLDAFLYEGSSPWQMTGQFYENWQNAIATDEDGSASYPEMLMLQLPSWGLYEDWQVAHKISPREVARTVIGGGAGPEHLAFVQFKRAIQSYDHQMRQMERANPETFEVERLSHWAPVLDAYLNSARVEEVFQPWRGRELVIGRRGLLGTSYVAHGDPANVNDRFGFAIAHVEEELVPQGDDRPPRVRRHVVFDVLHKWEAGDWPDKQVHYTAIDQADHGVDDDLWDFVRDWNPVELTFDQFASPGVIQELTKRSLRRGLPKRTELFIVNATEKLNWIRFECFKAAINLGLVHAPMRDDMGEVCEASEIAELELRHLQRKGRRVDHPSTGPVTSKDLADCMVETVWKLIGAEMAQALGESLAELSIRGVAARGFRADGSAVAEEAAEEAVLASLTSRGRPGLSPGTRRGAPTQYERRGRSEWGRRRGR